MILNVTCSKSMQELLFSYNESILHCYPSTSVEHTHALTKIWVLVRTTTSFKGRYARKAVVFEVAVGKVQYGINKSEAYK